ncbi:MAG: hypothetical protein KJO50_09220 [Bacteroidia bacterium]|nr:hypothetical protein [Bacteroidia bacterium]
MNLSNIILSALICSQLACTNSIQYPYSIDYTVSGFMVTDSSKGDKRFYIHRSEDGEFMELRFYHDRNQDLHFEEFGYVEVLGNYFALSNVIMVESIYSVEQGVYSECDEMITVSH